MGGPPSKKVDRAPARVWAELPPRVGAGPGSKWSWRSSPGWQQWERLAPLKQGRGAVPREPGGELRDSQGADQRELRLTGQRCTPKREAGARRGPNLPPGSPQLDRHWRTRKRGRPGGAVVGVSVWGPEWGGAEDGDCITVPFLP